MSLTDKQKANYERDGFVIYGSMLSEETLEALRERIDALADGSHPNAEKAGVRLEAAAQKGELENVSRRDKVWQLLDPHRYDEVIFEHASSPKILDIVAELLGTEDIKLFHTQTLMKPAFHGSIVSWHQGFGLLDFCGSAHACELLDGFGRCDRRERLPAIASRQLQERALAA